MEFKKPKLSNIIFIVFLALLIIPQTRMPIQVFLNKAIGMFSPSINGENERSQLSNYDLNMVGINGTPMNLKDASGKVILVNFWATWCPPCVAEMPSLQKLHNDYKEKVTFVFLTSDDKDAVSKFIADNQYDFPVYFQRSKAPTEINSSGIPATYLIDKNGAIVIDKVGAANWNSEKVRKTIDDLLSQ